MRSALVLTLMAAASSISCGQKGPLILPDNSRSGYIEVPADKALSTTSTQEEPVAPANTVSH
jgi:predicted small lipoprotein YifL